jgi:hypothetical protein
VRHCDAAPGEQEDFRTFLVVDLGVLRISSARSVSGESPAGSIWSSASGGGSLPVTVLPPTPWARVDAAGIQSAVRASAPAGPALRVRRGSR